MSSFKLTDARLDHPVLGTHCIQLRFDHPGGKSFNYQWPLNTGKSAYEIACDLHAFADKLNKDHVAYINAAEST